MGGGLDVFTHAVNLQAVAALSYLSSELNVTGEKFIIERKSEDRTRHAENKSLQAQCT